MERPNIEKIEKEVKRGTGYRRMQGTTLQLILWIKHLEEEKRNEENMHQDVDTGWSGPPWRG